MPADQMVAKQAEENVWGPRARLAVPLRPPSRGGRVARLNFQLTAVNENAGRSA
jgi:hypothetical protein